MILVTGGAGFIGSHVCDKLLDEGNTVICVDDFNDYYDPKIKESNIKTCLSNRRFKLYRHDIRDSDKLKKIFEENRIKKIIHLAARAGVRASINNPKLYHEVNAGGTLNLLELAKKFKIDNFVFSSSSSVYGINKKVPFSENDEVNNQISPYAVTKRIGELLCNLYHKTYNLNITCLRLFTVYGPRNRPDMALYKFTQSIDKGEELIMFGDGNSERDYTYVDDAVSAIMSATKNKFGFEIINIGNSKRIGLRDFILTIENALGKKAKIRKMKLQEGDVPLTYAGISKAKKLLKYNPKMKFEEGIKNFVEWYKNMSLV